MNVQPGLETVPRPHFSHSIPQLLQVELHCATAFDELDR